MCLILEVELKLCKVHGHSGFSGDCLQVDSLGRGDSLLYLPTSVGMTLEAQLGATEQRTNRPQSLGYS